MNEREAFMAAILAAPDDDTPRLMYSDWLKERGDSLGDFIEAQIRLHHEGKSTDRENPSRLPVEWLYDRSDPLTGRLWNQCAVLVLDHGRGWSEGVRAAAGQAVTVRGWSRGFPSSLSMRSVAWIDCADALTKISPIELVRLYGRVRVESSSEGAGPSQIHKWRFLDRSWVPAERGEDAFRFLLRHYWPKIKFLVR